MAGEHILIQVSPIWPLSSTTCIHKVAKASDLLCQIETRLIIYIPIPHQSKQVLEALVAQICQSLGLMINRKKLHLSPVQNLEFLGFQVCSTTLRSKETLEDMVG